MFFAQQDTDGGRAIAEAVTDVHGSIWILIAVGAIFLAGRFLQASLKTAVLLGSVIALLVLMNGPGLTGSGIEERWNDVKAKAEAFWKAENIRFDRRTG